MKKTYVIWFKDIDKRDIDDVGGKGANLGEMMRAGLPVPNGFVVSVEAYRAFLDAAHIRVGIEQALHGLDVNDSKALEKAARTVQSIITRSQFPNDIARDIINAYFKLSGGSMKHALVAVRSSATAEDLPGASFAGQQATFLNVQGESNVIEKVKEAWASLFTARAIFYRATNSFDHFKVGIAVPVQKMVASDKSGIMFTINPVTNDKSRVTIEAIFGLGEMIVQGAVTPDHYEVDKKTLDIVVKEAHVQEKVMVKKGGQNKILPLSSARGGQVKLADGEIVALAKLGLKLEQHYYFPQDIEWAIEGKNIFIVQTRPVTTVGKEATQTVAKVNAEVIAKGDPASPGVASGPVTMLASAKEIHKISAGDILVAEQTNPDFVPAMRKAVAIITERGGRTSHAAIVSRELGIPAVVGTKDIRAKVKDGMVVTVNGTTGEIYNGAVATRVEPKKTIDTSHMKTVTRVYVNLAEVSRAKDVAKMNCDGVGLLRAEFMIANIGTHPKRLIEQKKQKVFVDSLSEQLEVFCASFNPRPVVYRATDFKTNEYRNLKGGEAFEPEEPNPMLGFRGAARYLANSDVFELELQAITVVREKMGYKNLWLMLPFVRTPKELMDVKALIAKQGISRSASFKLWLMTEIPTNAIRIDDFLDVGVDGVSIGSNDLTMLILGTDRDNSEVAHDFSEMDSAVLWAFDRIVSRCAARGVTSSMCGQAPSDYPELVERLVKQGITSVSVNPDAIDRVRETIYECEKTVARKQ